MSCLVYFAVVVGCKIVVVVSICCFGILPDVINARIRSARRFSYICWFLRASCHAHFGGGVRAVGWLSCFFSMQRPHDQIGSLFCVGYHMLTVVCFYF